MRNIKALVKKEFFQIIRDPSSILIAFVLPFIMLMIFAFAINLDNNQIRVGLLIDGYRQEMNSLVSAFEGTDYLHVTRYTDRDSLSKALVAGDIKAGIVFPNNFAKELMSGVNAAPIQVLTDATDPNMATFVAAYAQGVALNWQKIFQTEKAIGNTGRIEIDNVVWFNPELKSQYFILPSSIAIIMSLVGMILTALVIAREWERGTMEALLTTKATKFDIIVAKYIAYYGLAMCSTAFCSVLCILFFGVPFRGSYIVYFIMSSLFIATSLGQGFIISTLAKNQFLASISAATFGFLPAVMLSGALFEIPSMPKAIQWVTYFIPARYFTTTINNLYMAGNIWSVIIPQGIFMLIFALIVFVIVYRLTKERLE